MGFRVWGVGSGFRVSGFRSLGLRISGSGCSRAPRKKPKTLNPLNPVSWDVPPYTHSPSWTVSTTGNMPTCSQSGSLFCLWGQGGGGGVGEGPVARMWGNGPHGSSESRLYSRDSPSPIPPLPQRPPPSPQPQSQTLHLHLRAQYFDQLLQKACLNRIPS